MVERLSLRQLADLATEPLKKIRLISGFLVI
jgi:hypothetical protein